MKKAHPLAGLVPEMTHEEFDLLLADIHEHGLLSPILLYEDAILDGRHRYRAVCDLAERGVIVKPRFEEFCGTHAEAASRVVSLNIHRRHLTTGQRAMIAVPLKQAISESRGGQGARTDLTCGNIATSEEPQKARDIAAATVNVSARSVQAAEKLSEDAPHLAEQVRNGHMELWQAEKEHKKEERARTQEARKSIPPPDGKHRVIYADPPWDYNDSGLQEYGHASYHYPSMTQDELCALPIADIAQDDAVLFLWATSPMLETAFAVARAWGFQYKTSFVWDKVLHNFGHYNSVRHELLLVCTRGSCTPDTSELFDSVQTIERSKKHSEKPERFRQIIDALYTSGTRIELFSRTDAEGWIRWGNEPDPPA